jgi:ceramide glucosyltransferase
LIARELVRRFARRADDARSEQYSVTILKPLCGQEIGLRDNLETFCKQDYRAPVQIIFGLQSEADPAVSVVRELMSEFPDQNLRLVVDDAQHGSNRKVSSLINMAGYIEHDVLVLADSDVAVDSLYLQRLCGALERPGVGLVTCLYRGLYTGTLWSRLACMGMEFHFLPSVVVGLAMGLAEPCLGPTMALRRETLSAIGGFRTLANQLADDYALGVEVTKLGGRIEFPAFLIAHNCPERSLGELFRHELRWARTIFRIDKIGFIGAGVTHAFPLALLAASLRGFDFWGCSLLVFALACRLWLQAGVAGAYGLSAASLPLAPLRDLISFFVYLACFFGSRVDWRGRVYSVDPKGYMMPLEVNETGKPAQ